MVSAASFWERLAALVSGSDLTVDPATQQQLTEIQTKIDVLRSQVTSLSQQADTFITPSQPAVTTPTPASAKGRCAASQLPTAATGEVSVCDGTRWVPAKSIWLAEGEKIGVHVNGYLVTPGLSQTEANVSSYFKGKVGIGTTWPTQKLEVNGAMRLGAVLLYQIPACTADTRGVIIFVTEILPSFGSRNILLVCGGAGNKFEWRTLAQWDPPN